jgi:hypothetical protein
MMKREQRPTDEEIEHALSSLDPITLAAYTAMRTNGPNYCLSLAGGLLKMCAEAVPPPPEAVASEEEHRRFARHYLLLSNAAAAALEALQQATARANADTAAAPDGLNGKSARRITLVKD